MLVQAHDEQLLQGAENTYCYKHGRKVAFTGQEDQADGHYHQYTGKLVAIGVQ